MAATYLLRFDDFCPTMNWTVWRQIESALDDSGVRPILAVVPDNRDPELAVAPAQDGFWDAVRGWQSRGWTIGLHGYQHRYLTAHAGVIGRNRYSEFAGLSYELQLAMLKRGLAIFEREGVQPDIWIAPAHSFDAQTLRALADCGLHTVSDGYSLLPHTDAQGTFWIPQQMGRFRELPCGVWTVCLHHNRWTTGDVRRFRGELALYRNRISSVPETIDRYAGRPRKWMDRMSTNLMSMARMGKAAFSEGAL